MALLERRFGPEAAGTPPEIDDRTAFWLYVFEMLSPSRPVSDSGPRPIPVSEIKAQCEFTPLPATNDEVQAVLRAMDSEFLDWAHESRKQGAKKR